MLSEPCSAQQRVAPFIEGALVESQSDSVFESINPSTGQAFSTIPAGCREDVDRAVAVAARVFGDGRWSDAAPSVKKDRLHELADLIEEAGGALDALDAGDMGKPVGETFGNAKSAAGLMRFYAEAVDKLSGDVYTSDKSSFVTQRRVPRGVVAAVVPWNFPTYNAVLKLAPALAAGNCVVLKPSELSSRSAMCIAGLAMRAGIPPGVVNVVPGLGETVGQALGLHPNVDMLTFTGSTQVGKLMLRYAGESNMKVVMTECGGKSPHIVFDDGMDLDAVGEAVAGMLLINQGQLCSVGSRLLVQRSAESALLERVSACMKRIKIGDALDASTTFGPVVSARQCSRIMHYIETAEAEGARLLTGGGRVLRETGGYFVAPTIFHKVSPTSRIAQEEIFGPVLSVMTFDDEAEAIRIANSTAYGLATYVWTANLSTGLRMARGVRSSVWVNAVRPAGEGAGHAASFEPAAQSGLGTEGGLAGMESYLRRQLVWINHA